MVGGSFSTDFGNKITTESINDLLHPKIPDITDRHTEIIKNQLKKKKDFEHYIEKWIYQEFVNSGGSLQLDFFEFGNHFALSDDLRRIMFEKLMSSQNFSSYGYSEDGRPIQRMALRPEYLRSLQQ